MKKKLLLVFCLFESVFSLFAAKQTRDISDERAIILMNYLQYSSTQVIENPNKIVASHEFDSIINQINPTTLKDPDIIAAYNDMLSTFTELKLLDNQKQYAAELAERERKNAINSILQGTGSALLSGVASMISGNIAGGIVSMAYAGLNAGLNYKNAKDQAAAKKIDTEFQISQQLLADIDDCRRRLYISTANVFSSRDDTVKVISEELMTDFVKVINTSNLKVKENNLFHLQDVFEYFPPYWYALGYVQQQNGKYAEALKSYQKYDTLLTSEPVLKYDEMYCQVYLSQIDIYRLLGKGAVSPEIQNCIKKIEDQIKISPLATKTQLYYAIADGYWLFGDYEDTEKKLDHVESFGFSNWSSSARSLRETLKKEENALKESIESESKSLKELIEKYSSVTFKVNSDKVIEFKSELTKLKSFVESISFNRRKIRKELYSILTDCKESKEKLQSDFSALESFVENTDENLNKEYLDVKPPAKPTESNNATYKSPDADYNYTSSNNVSTTHNPKKSSSAKNSYKSNTSNVSKNTSKKDRSTFETVAISGLLILIILGSLSVFGIKSGNTICIILSIFGFIITLFLILACYFIFVQKMSF